METRALIELLNHHDEVIGRYRVGPQGLTIGRGVACDVVLEDPHTAAHHASIVPTEEGWELVLEPSINGGWHDGQHLPGGSRRSLPASGELELGQTRIRLRHPREALPEETPLPEPHQKRLSWTRFLPSPKAWLLVTLVCAWNLGSAWLDSQPDTTWAVYFDELMSTLGAALLWGGLWGLMSQLIRRRMPFWTYMQIGLLAFWATQGTMLLMSTLAYATSTPWLDRMGTWVIMTGLTLASWLCARHVWPKRQGRTAAILAGMLLLMIVPTTIKLQIHQHRWLQPLYMTTLAPPALRLAKPKPASAFMAELSPLQDSLRQAAQEDEHLSDPALEAADEEE